MEDLRRRIKASPVGRLNDYSAAFWFMLTANVLFFFSFQSTFPVLPRFIAEVVLERPSEGVGGEVGLATTAAALVAVLTRVPAGRLTDRWGRKRFLLVGAMCFIAAPLIYAASRDMLLLLLGRVVHGLGLGVFTTAFQAFAAELAPADRRGEALGLAGGSTSVAFVTAPLAGDWLAASRGYTLMFQVSAASAALSVLMVFLIGAAPWSRPAPAASLKKMATPDAADPPRGVDELEGTPVGLRLALARTGVRAGILTMAALGIPFGAFITFLPLFADERKVVGVGVVFSVYAATVLLAQPLAGALADRIGRQDVILPGLVVTGLGTAVIALNGPSILFTLAGIVFGVGGGLVRGGVDPLVQDSVPSTLRGTAAAVQYTSFDFLIGVGSYPLGIMANSIGYAAMFLVSGAISVLGAVALVLLLRRAQLE